jgi:hypothetical protein
MMENLPPAVQRAMAATLAFVAIAALAAILFFPAIAARQLDTQTKAITAETDGLQATLIRRENLLAEQRLLERTADETQMAIEADSAGLAGPILQNWARSIIEGIGAEVRSTQILQANDVGDFNEIRVNFTFVAKIEEIRDILYELETHVPVMLVATLSIIRETDALDADINQPLDVDMLVVGYRRNEAAAE